MTLYFGHVQVLQALVKTGETQYPLFRSRYNPWRTEAYFDGQMRRLYNRGYVDYSKRTTIAITEKGRDLLERNNTRKDSAGRTLYV